jgi:hypothetical protein
MPDRPGYRPPIVSWELQHTVQVCTKPPMQAALFSPCFLMQVRLTTLKTGANLSVALLKLEAQLDRMATNSIEPEKATFSTS